ncbi:MAG: hypothetical protein JWO25_1801 [Alphaproteobacteria bacterium]|nr:hypothetical protein [Alphaproteobacteria bacterium]
MKPAFLHFLLASAALAAPLQSTRAAQPGAAPEASTREEIQAIRAEMRALQTRLDRLEAAANPPGAQSATAAAPAATATAEVAPVSAPPSMAAAPPAWTAGTTIGGKAFMNVGAIDQKSDGVKSGQSGLQADVKRFYLTVDHRFNDIFSANLTTDFRYNANGTTRDTLVYVKKAYLQARFGPEFFVRLGAADLPWVPFDEDAYGYRYVENVVVDRTRYGTAVDWGLHVGGTLGGGLFSYAASAVNGAGYKTLSRSSDTIDLEGRITAQPIKGLSVSVGGYSGKLGKSAVNGAATPHRATRWNALVAYASGPVRAGVEYFRARNWNNVTTVSEDRTSGWSAYGSFAVRPGLALFGRYDRVDPNQQSDPDQRDDYFNLGLSYQLLKNVDLALVYKREAADGGVIPTSNGNIGGINRGTYDELGLWTQLKF